MLYQEKFGNPGLVSISDVVGADGETRHVVRPTCLKWYPDSMAWQLNLTRKDIRRQEIYFKLHNFLISETESGNRVQSLLGPKPGSCTK
jgi:hypothetical protein